MKPKHYETSKMKNREYPIPNFDNNDENGSDDLLPLIKSNAERPPKGLYYFTIPLFGNLCVEL